MKLLIVNPNRSEKVTEVIARSAARVLPEGVETQFLTNRKGASGIDCWYADYRSLSNLLPMVEAAVKQGRPDALVLAGFGQVGLPAFKEIFDFPVVGIAEASYAMATLLGHRFAVLTMLDTFVPYQEDLIHVAGLESRCVAVEAVGLGVEACTTEREWAKEHLRGRLKQLAAKGAEVVLLGCAGLCGYDQEMQEETPLVLLDPVCIGVSTAVQLVCLGLAQSKARAYAMPPQPLSEYTGTGR